jgi:hypothetical protein
MHALVQKHGRKVEMVRGGCGDADRIDAAQKVFSAFERSAAMCVGHVLRRGWFDVDDSYKDRIVQGGIFGGVESSENATTNNADAQLIVSCRQHCPSFSARHDLVGTRMFPSRLPRGMSVD